MLFQGQKNKIKEQELIQGILHDDPETIKYIYAQNFLRIKNMVNGFKNITIEPDDVFQESLTRAIINVKRGKFNGGSTFATYLYGISRNICLKDYEKNRNMRLVRDEEIKITEDSDDEYFENLNNLLEVKKQLDDKCVQIINLRFGMDEYQRTGEMRRFDDVASVLGITTENARQRFSRCLSKLKKLITKFKIS